MHGSVDNSPIRSEAAASPIPSNMLRLLWQRKWLVLLGVVAGLVGGAMIYARTPPVYRSGSQILVIKKRTEMLPIGGTDVTQMYLDDYISTHILIIKSPEIIEQAVKKLPLAEMRTFQNEPNPGTLIFSGLTASRDSSGNNRTIIDLSFQGPYPDEIPAILNAVIDSYKDFLGGAYNKASKETESLIKRAQELLENDLKIKKSKYLAFRKRMDPLLGKKGKEGVTIHQARLFNIEERRSALMLQKADAESRLRIVEEARKAGKADIALLPVPAERPKEGAVSSPGSKRELRGTDETLVFLALEEQELLEDFGPDHPKVKAIRAKIARAQRILDTGRVEGSEVLAGAGSKPETLVERYLRVTRNELAQILVSLDALTQLANTEVARAKELQVEEDEEERLSAEIGDAQRLYQQTMKSLSEINLVRNFGGYEPHVIARPGEGARVAASLYRTLMFALGFGLAVGLGLAYLADVSDRSFRTPEEIRRSLGLPILGHIPHMPRAEKSRKETGAPKTEDGFSPALYVHHQPTSMESEAYRSLRTALFFGVHGETHKILQVTSPNMGDGKTTLAANLAITIAQSGKRVVIIDGDFRRPRLHRLFGVASSVPGITSVLGGELTLAQAIRPTSIAGLDLLPCGIRPSNPAELLTSREFEQVLEELRADYDFILVDTPPLLAVTDPCVVAGRVDGVLLTIRVSKNGRPAAERAKELLSNIGVHILGVVVNGIGKDSGGTGYGYRYYAYDHYGYEYRSTEEETPPSTEATKEASE